MEVPPQEFFDALKIYPGELETAKSLLTGEDAYSKSLLALILTRISEDNDAQVAEMLPTIDTSGNDIAMMLCFMTYEYRLETTKAKNLIFKRFGKAEVQADVEVQAEAEAPEAEAEAAPEAEVPEAAPEAAPEAKVPEEAVSEKKPEEKAEAEAEIPEAVAPKVSDAVAPKVPEAVTNQKGGSKKKRPLKLRKTKRASRP